MKRVLSAVAALLGAAAAGAAPPRGPSADGALAPPPQSPRPDAEGTLRSRWTDGNENVLRLRMSGLAPRARVAVRIAQDDRPVLGGARADRRGRSKIVVRPARLDGDVPAVLAGRPVEIEDTTDALAPFVALVGEIPVVDGYPAWDDDEGGTGGGGGGGGGGGATTRLPGVDGDGPNAVSSATFSLPTAPGGLAPGNSVVHYPGSGATVTTSALPNGWPCVVFVHGFSLDAASYSGWGRTLATWGMVTLVLDHADPPLIPDNEKEVQTTLGGLSWLVAQNTDPQSRFYGKLDTSNVAFVGHSLGGGAAIVAATRAASAGRVQAAVGLAPAALSRFVNFSQTAIPPDTASGWWPPTLVVTGSQDSIVTPATSRTTYFTPAPSPRTFLRFAGHCHMSVCDSLPSLAQLGNDYNAATCVAPAEQRRQARQFVVPFLMSKLTGDGRVSDYVDGTFAAEQTNLDERTFE